MSEAVGCSRVLIYVHSGCLELACGDGVFELGPSSFLHYSSDADLKLVERESMRSMVYRVEYVEPSGAKEGPADPVAIGELFDPSEQGMAVELLNQLVVLSLRNDNNASNEAGTILLRVLLSLLRERSRIVGTSSDNAPGYSTYLRALDVIRERFYEIGSSAEIAKAVDVSSGHLARLFRDHDSQRPYDRLLAAKMRRAAELLSRGDLLVKEVAAEVGYSNSLHFSRVFKKHFGVPPLAYAKEA